MIIILIIITIKFFIVSNYKISNTIANSNQLLTKQIYLHRFTWLLLAEGFPNKLVLVAGFASAIFTLPYFYRSLKHSTDDGFFIVSSKLCLRMLPLLINELVPQVAVPNYARLFARKFSL